MISKFYLLVVSLLYFALAIWCSVLPETTSQKVGFDLQAGTGQSEFLTVYGGLEFGMALIFLLSAVVSQATRHGVIACVLLHGSLVVFRTVGFCCFSAIDSFTYKLAAGEWGIAVAGVAILALSRKTELK